MRQESAALYVHFPYCLSICPYCDFDRQATGFDSIPEYVECVATEISQQRPRRLHSVFFGGGTPSLMDVSQVRRILLAAEERFEFLPSCEVTLEANPAECSPERLAGFRASGVNRLSIGVQSLDDGSLRKLGRRHSAQQARTAFGAAREAGFDNVNLDLMLGLPDMTSQSWLETLEGALELGPEHLSCYILTVDERVPMGRDVARGRIQLPEDDGVAEQYTATQDRLAEAGYQQYEISNWARLGCASRHNVTYWRDEPYIGVGAGAAGWLDGTRTKNTPSPRRYIQSMAKGSVERIEEERPDPMTQMRDFIALGLRLREGLDPDRFKRRFSATLADTLGAALVDLEAAGCLEWVRGRLRVARHSMLVTNEIMLRLEEGLADRRERAPAGELLSGSIDAGSEAVAQLEKLVLTTPR